MTKQEFKTFWAHRYPKSIPISYRFRHDYPDRWFRIHSLPESKRYPENEEEWNILLNRQNSIITDILGNNSTVLLVTGDYVFENSAEHHSFEAIDSIKRFLFTTLEPIDLHEFHPEEYDKGEIYQPLFCTSVWSKNQFDDVLRDVAQDHIRIIFISTHDSMMIIPYDGGVDVILQNTETRNKYKTKYSNWLSNREDGL